VPFIIDRQKHLVQMPLVPGARPAATELVGIALPELSTPLSDGLVRHDNTAFKQEFLDVTVREAKAVVEPDRVADDLAREAVAFVGIGRRSGWHGSSIERDKWNK
jgi:hypothetical protein